jgi:hypothetical protein
MRSGGGGRWERGERRRARAAAPRIERGSLAGGSVPAVVSNGGAGNRVDAPRSGLIRHHARQAKSAIHSLLNECSEKIQSSPECTCPTYINPANAAYAKLQELLKLYGSMGCQPTIECSCAMPAAGVCATDPSGASHCVDAF